MLIPLPRENSTAFISKSGEERLLEALLWDGLRNQADLAGAPSLTQERLVELTGLSRNSVKSYTSTKLRSVLEPGGPLALQPEAGYALGVDFARTHKVRVALVNLRGHWGDGGMLPQITEVDDEPQPSASDTLENAANRIWEVMGNRKIKPSELVGVGIGIATPSVPDKSAGNAAFGHWQRWASPGPLLKNALNEKWQAQGVGSDAWSSLDFVADNDTNLSAIADHLWGGSPAYNCGLFVKWNSSVRAALILDGCLYTGSAGFAGELPHMKIEDRDEECGSESCTVEGKKGCIYGLAPIEKLGDNDLAGTLQADRIIEKAAEEGDQGEKVRKALKDAAWGIGRAIAPLAVGINAETIVIGGALGARAYPQVLESLRAGVESCSRTAEFAVTNSTIRNRGTVRGAATLALLKFAPGYLKRKATAPSGNENGHGRQRPRKARQQVTALGG